MCIRTFSDVPPPLETPVVQLKIYGVKYSVVEKFISVKKKATETIRRFLSLMFTVAFGEDKTLCQDTAPDGF